MAKENTAKNRGIIFDLDGTLWDSSIQVVTAWNRALETCPDVNYRITVEDMKGFMGKTIEVIAKLFFRNVSEARGMEIVGCCLAEEVKALGRGGGTLYPRVEETLQLLSEKYRLAIVSNCQTDYLETFLSYHRLGQYFCDFECAGRTRQSKGENIKLVIERNCFDQAVYIGDTQGDCDAAKDAKVPFIFASYGFGSIEGGAQIKIQSIGELPAVAEKILSGDT